MNASSHLLTALAVTTTLAIASPIQAGSTFLFNASQSYTGVGSSPFAAMENTVLVVENFENGTIHPAITAVKGFLMGPSKKTDSVDEDTGSINGSGQGGHSWATTGRVMAFKFADVNGAKPTMAGLVWTDGRPNTMVTFRAWDANGNLLGKIKARLGDLKRNGGTAEDRFFGIMSDEGISRIRINTNKAGFEVDHVQFAYGFSVVPVPPAVGIGLAGLAGLGLWRRMTGRRTPGRTRT